MDAPEFADLNEALSALRAKFNYDFKSWEGCVKKIPDVLNVLRVSQDAFDNACVLLGQPIAMAILLTMLEKQFRSPGFIRYPARYFKACVRLASKNKLKLKHTLHGLKDPYPQYSFDGF